MARKTSVAADADFAPRVLDEVLYKALETLCRDAMLYSGGANSVRLDIGNIISSLRRVAHSRFGHDSVDIIGLVGLLRRNRVGEEDQIETRTGPLPALMELESQQALSANELGAAYLVRDIWSAFGRYLEITAKTYGKSSSPKYKVLQPVEVMDQELFDNYREHYKPWYRKACRRPVAGLGVQHLNGGSLVVRVVVEEKHPVLLDRYFLLEEGTCLAALRNELDRLAATS